MNTMEDIDPVHQHQLPLSLTSIEKPTMYDKVNPHDSSIWSHQVDKLVLETTDIQPIEVKTTFDSDEDAGRSRDSLDLEASSQVDNNSVADQKEPIEENHANSWSTQSASLMYIVLYAEFGCVARVFIGRFFGSDCDQRSDTAPNDFLSPFFSNICVTTSGTTEQTGGALFLDLPANIIGCFIMGMITHPDAADYPLPWLRSNHPLQSNNAFLAGLRTGLCGCLTTFASWNTQMVRMLDGSYTVLGPQVVSALFGYVVGMSGAVSCFLMGRLTHEFLRSSHFSDKTSLESDEHERQKPRRDREFRSDASAVPSPNQDSVTTSRISSGSFYALTLPLLSYAALLSLFIVGAVMYEIEFYQQLVISSVLGPVGAILRWVLSALNSRKGGCFTTQWVPWGTFTANIVASLLSLAISAVQLQYLADFDMPWVSGGLLPAIKSGLCGSLSTVSTLINEMFVMKQRGQALAYATGSMLCAMLLGLLVFSPIVRS